MTKLDELTGWFEEGGRTLVALSGGVDSALVAYAARRGLGDYAAAVTADYRTLSAEELESARDTCAEIGIRHIMISYDELENGKFAANDQNRCFHCRTELGGHLTALARRCGAQSIVDGTNIDDLGDYRPGIDAMRKHGIHSPLVEVGLGKDDVRAAAKSVGLTVHDRPSNSCLASRIPWGRRVTVERLARIELGERLVRSRTGLRQVRVRDMDGVARIEVDAGEAPAISGGQAFADLDSQLRLIGFRSVIVDPEGYRPGRLNVISD